MEENISGNRIRVARLMKKPPMNQQELLAKLQNEGVDISQSTLSKIENGDRYITDVELKVFAKILNVSILWLLDETKYTNTNTNVPPDFE